MIDSRLLGIINVTGTGHREVPLKTWSRGEKSEFRLYKEPRRRASHVYLWQCCVLRGIPAGIRSTQLCHSDEHRLLQISYSSIVNIALIQSREETVGEGGGCCWLTPFPVEMLQGRQICTYIFQAAHEVVADWWARQVRRVQAAPYVEEIIGAQHGVVLLSVAGGGENAIHQDRHLEGKTGSRAHEILSRTERTGLIISSSSPLELPLMLELISPDSYWYIIYASVCTHAYIMYIYLYICIYVCMKA